MCVRLPDGRVGARITGWNRPIRDDVLDTHPHGTINMHDGFVHSCNAYFAQLAVSSDRSRCSAAANRLGISLTPASDAARTRSGDASAGWIRTRGCRDDTVADGARGGGDRITWSAAGDAVGTE